jgi:hypothetical protein
MDFASANVFDGRVLSTSRMTHLPSEVPNRKIAKGFFGTILRTVTIIGTILAVIALIFTVTYHLRLSSNIHSRLAVLRDAHKPLTLSELNRYYPAVPAESNAAVIYARAFDLLRTNASFASLENPPPGADPLPVQLRKAMEKACEENVKTFEELQKAALFELCRYPVDYTPGWSALLPHLPSLLKCAVLEMCRGILQEQKGDIQQAIATIDTIMCMAASLDSEPDLISVLVQNRLYFRGSDLLGWLLNHRQLTSEQLAELQRIFQSAGRTNGLARALVAERCATLATFNDSAKEILKTIDPGSEKRATVVLSMYFLQITGALKRDEIRYLDRMSGCETISSQPSADGLKLAETLRLEVQRDARKSAILTAMFVPGMLRGFERNAERIAQQRLVQTALAIEQYRINQNRLPNSLAELAPRLLPEIPIDPFDDIEIRYRPEGGTYAVYSVGPDLTDDGGRKQIPRAAKIDHPKGDIVFAVDRKSERNR